MKGVLWGLADNGELHRFPDADSRAKWVTEASSLPDGEGRRRILSATDPRIRTQRSGGRRTEETVVVTHGLEARRGFQGRGTRKEGQHPLPGLLAQARAENAELRKKHPTVELTAQQARAMNGEFNRLLISHVGHTPT